jgi:hypothetical protein
MYANPYVGLVYGNPVTNSPRYGMSPNTNWQLPQQLQQLARQPGEQMAQAAMQQALADQMPQQQARGGVARMPKVGRAPNLNPDAGMSDRLGFKSAVYGYASGGEVDEQKLHHLARSLDWSEFLPTEVHHMLTGHAMNQMQKYDIADDDEDDAPSNGKVHYERVPLKGAGYRIPSDAVQRLGRGDYYAAYHVLDRMFGTGRQADPAKIPPRALKQLGDGDELKGHRVLDAFVKYVRGHGVKLKNGQTVRRHDVA